MSEWKPIDGYLVSNVGEVKSLAGRMLKQWPNDQGYMMVRLNSPRRLARVHRLVALAFLPNPESKPYINHIDCNRANNNASNLEWCTQAENLEHSTFLGRMNRNYWTGRRSPNASLDAHTVRAIRRAYAMGEHSHASLAKEYGLSKRAVGRLVNLETYADVK